MATPVLTQMRQALWTALEADAAWAATVKSKFKWEDPGAVIGGFDDFTPAIGECPAVAIFPVTSPSPWHANQMQKIAYGLVMRIWMPEFNVKKAERLWQLSHRAFWQAASATWEKYYRDSIFGSPTQWRTVGSDDGDDSVELLELSWPVELRFNWNPNTDTGTLD